MQKELSIKRQQQNHSLLWHRVLLSLSLELNCVHQRPALESSSGSQINKKEKKRRRGEFYFLDRKAFSLPLSLGGSVVVVNPLSLHFGQLIIRCTLYFSKGLTPDLSFSSRATVKGNGCDGY
jgi:hypothetical protein